MKSNKKRILSIFLAFVMILTIVPLNAFAEENSTNEETPVVQPKEDDKPVTPTTKEGEPTSSDSGEENLKIFTVEKVKLKQGETGKFVAKEGDSVLTGVTYENINDEGTVVDTNGNITVAKTAKLALYLIKASKEGYKPVVAEVQIKKGDFKKDLDDWEGSGTANITVNQPLTAEDIKFIPALPDNTEIIIPEVDTSETANNIKVNVTLKNGGKEKRAFVYVNIRKEQVTINFYVNNKVKVYNTNIDKGSKIGDKLYRPSEYDWYKNEKFTGQPVTKDEVFNKNTDLYGKSKKQQPYNINYHLMYDAKTKLVLYNKSVLGKDLEKFTRPGYKFLGWYLDKELKNPVASSKEFTKNTDVYAGWEKIECNLYIKATNVYRDYVSGYTNTPYAEVRLYDYDGDFIKKTTSDKDGYFKINYDFGYYYGKYWPYHYKYYNDKYYYNKYYYRNYYLVAVDGNCVSNKEWIKSYYYYYDYPEKLPKYYDGCETRVYPTNISRTNYSTSGYISYRNEKIFVYDGSTYLGSDWTDSKGFFKVTWSSPYVSTNRTLDYYIGRDCNKRYTLNITITHANDTDKFVKGKAASFANVEIYDSNNILLGKAVADRNGYYTVYLNRYLKAGEKIKAVAKETNKYDTVAYKVVDGSVKTEIIRKAYIIGYPDGTFKPYGKVTRAEAAEMFATLINGSKNFGTSKVTKFKDANNGWYSQSINYVVAKGLIKGYGDNTFRPNAPISRAEFAQMISGYINTGLLGKSQFKDTRGHWAQDAIDKVYGNKNVKGYPDGTFKPNKEITRAEAVTILNSVFGRYTDSSSIRSAKISDLKTYKDVTTSHWAYYQILDASNYHVSYEAEGEKAEVWK